MDKKRLILKLVAGLALAIGIAYWSTSRAEYRADKTLAERQERIASLERTQAALEERNANLDTINQQHVKRISQLERKLASMPAVPNPATPTYIPEADPLAERLRSVGLGTTLVLGNESRPLGFGIEDGNKVYRWGLDQPRLEALSLRVPVLEKLHDEDKSALDDFGKQIEVGKLQHSNDLAIIGEERGKFKDLEKKVAAQEKKNKLKTAGEITLAVIAGYLGGKHL